MTKIAQISLAAVINMTLLSAGVAQEKGKAPPSPQMRTYVSGNGSDGNPCTDVSPCKSFGAALALTIAGGEIFVLDSADYGPVTITKSVTITSEGAVAGLLAANGAAITITAGANDVVHLRGLDLDGAGTGSYGIVFNSGRALTVQKSAVRAFANSGINFTPSAASALFVADTTLSNNRDNGILISSAGTGVVNGMLNRITVAGNGVGILINGANVNVTVNDALANNNTYGIGATASAVMVRNSTMSSNSVGIAADQNAVVRVGQSTVTGNATGWRATNGGQTQSYGNNNVSGNTSDGTASTTAVLQ